MRQKGFRTKELVVVTTLLDAETYPADEIAMLYRRRWQAELNLRSLKIVLQMDHLRCKTPHRVRNEFYMHLVAYNLIRQLMAVAGSVGGRGTLDRELQRDAANDQQPAAAVEHTRLDADWCQALLDAIATHIVGNRPDRFEPRVRKRRPKKYKLMREPRENYKRRMAA